MSVSSVIEARDVAKRYRLGGPQQRTNSLREAVAEAWRAPVRRWREGRPLHDDGPNTFWALQGIDFDVQQGEVLGLIGRNGAGKSTLLKVLSRITEPTRGRIVLHGRVASLLEVGTGFHSELTGRENIYLNGTILGMRKREIDRKLDEIVAFAEIEKFVDTPVKRYSSGMYVRLAFAVAAHLEPEILIVDEVLAVGDAEFQRKCIGKMGDVARGGRTVLFVSHNMAAVQGLCTRALVLEQGRVAFDGDVTEAIRRYLEKGKAAAASRGALVRTGPLRPTRVEITDAELLVNGAPASQVTAGDSCTIRVHYRTLAPEFVGCRFSPQIRLVADGQKVATLWPNMLSGLGVPVAESGAIDCQIERWPFRSRSMVAEIVGFVGLEPQEHIIDALVFDSHDGDYHGSGIVPHPDDGFVFLEHSFEHAEDARSTGLV
jgi:lipopolysaccharide transport system ATP-binding protein